MWLGAMVSYGMFVGVIVKQHEGSGSWPCESLIVDIMMIRTGLDSQSLFGFLRSRPWDEKPSKAVYLTGEPGKLWWGNGDVRQGSKGNPEKVRGQASHHHVPLWTPGTP